MERSRGDSVPSNGNVKIGGLWKRAQCLSKFTKPNYKHRVFILTDQALSYYCGTVDRVGQLKGRVDLQTVRAVEFVDESAFNLAHTLQVVYHHKKYGFVTLYITATDKRECVDWTASLRQACYFNQDMLMHYHPGALLKGKWSCCQQRCKTSLGCQPTYHLLTRSSSRYAQMRRRDTLSGSHGHRRSRTAGHSFEDRRSVASGTQNDVEVAAEGRPGAGLSNSCIDLAQRPPHKMDTFAQDIPPSRRSSRQSTEPSGSVGIDSITLTRVSLVEAGALVAGSEEVERGTSSEPKETEAQGPPSDENRSSRYQVAPETTPAQPLSHFPIHNLRLEPEQKTVPATRPRGQSLGNECFSSSQRENSPPFPSRYRNSIPTTSSFHGIISVIPSVTPIRENQEPGTSRMKHSQTFMATSSIIPSAQHCKLSSSMSALCHPLISPRISHTDPNIIHV